MCVGVRVVVVVVGKMTFVIELVHMGTCARCRGQTLLTSIGRPFRSMKEATRLKTGHVMFTPQGC